jgi:CRISPR-associated protein Csd1
MSWLAKLYETYDHIDSKIEQNSLWPISHFVKNAHVEVVISSEGEFLKGRSKILNGAECPTLIPATESSAGRAGAKIAPHPLCDEIGYCASDHPKISADRADAYLTQIKGWAESELLHPKLTAIYRYLKKGRLWADLSNEIDFPVTVIKQDKKTKEKVAVEKTFIRWRVEEVGNPVSGTWEDKGLIEAWIDYDAGVNSKPGFCVIDGNESRVAQNHSRFIRWPGDGAKLISSNDHSGFTFRGRFTDSKTTMDREGIQSVSIGYVPTQKAHNALRWLLSNQGFRNGEQAYVAWAISGKPIPDPFQNTLSLLDTPITFQELVEDSRRVELDHGIDLGASFAQKLHKYLAGYSVNPDPNEQIVVMGIDSATTGRMAVIYYRELMESEFFERLNRWHNNFAWIQNFGKEAHFVGAPSPKDIAWAAHCTKLGESGRAEINEKLQKSVVERLLPCIIDGVPVPRDLILSSVRRVSNRVGLDRWEWEKCLGIACSLYKGTNCERRYEMALEEDRITRDYLYGRLLAVAEQIESMALFFAHERRDTTAARLMQRFSDRPFSTWKTIEDALVPYKARIQTKASGLLDGYKELLDHIHDLFEGDDYVNDGRLSGEYLLGYHCQRKWLRDRKRKNGQWVSAEDTRSEIQNFDEDE